MILLNMESDALQIVIRCVRYVADVIWTAHDRPESSEIATSANVAK
jgi:hypothetical protein